MKGISFYLLFTAICILACQDGTDRNAMAQETGPPPKKVVFVTGDEEYRSEESMPMLAEILHRELGCEVNVCYSLDSTGQVDPNNLFHIAGLEALKDADLMVMFTRFRELPEAELKMITDYAESGRPMVGFRTATHAFQYKIDTTKKYYNEEWPIKVFGQKWITHHGHFDDGSGILTKVEKITEKNNHPILRGVQNFDAYSWLYHVDGGNHKLYGDSDPLLIGTAQKSNHEQAGRLEEFPLTNPVAWTKTYSGAEKTSRVFFTTLGHPYDFKNESMRKLAINGIYWALGLENQIPATGINVEFVSEYQPNNSGFGDKFKKNLEPKYLPKT